ncbi:MAG: hypothetical protein AAGE85_04430 [Pseudomonadota bacterium]
MDDPTTATPGKLFDSASRCDSMPDAVFLLMIGQIRAITDLSAFPAKSEADEALIGKLYERMYYRMGGSGPDELYRDDALYGELIDRIRNWRPTDLPGYEPGWEYSSTPSYQEYYRKVEEAKAFRLQQLASYYALVSDDEYFELKVQADEILRRNDNTLVNGSPDDDRYSELARAMNEVKRRIRNDN